MRGHGRGLCITVHALPFLERAVCLSQAVCIFVSDQIMIDVFQVPPGLEMHVFGLIMASSRVAS